MRTVTIWVYEPNKFELNARKAAHLYPVEDADAVQYDLPEGWSVAENQLGDPLLVSPAGKGASIVPVGSGMAAITSDGITWLHKTGAKTGQQIKEARESAGLTIRELAAKAGVAVNTISLIEGGKSVPRADILRKIANALGRSMDELWPE